ncbi:MAG: VWA domain-containing protein [Verrucomicrobia bacterium]|nr:VWA domain-containing protein [Verrucomicrobiota bacterium]
MSFQWPHLFWLLLLPAALLAWELSRRRRAADSTHPKILRAEAGSAELRLADFRTAPSVAASRPRYWLCAALVLAIIALARPQWGRIEEPVFDQSREILLALDLSRSMLAPDVKPTRLDRAKLLITSLLEKLSGERVGLVVFAGTSFLQSPLSADYEILREFLPALNPEFLPQGGSNYTALLNASTEAFSATNSADRFLIILSDGEATEEGWRERIEELKKKNVRVIGLGVGTAAGAMIPDNAGGFVKDERGAVVLSKLENATLQELARATNGAYRDASSWIDLAALVKETVDAGRKGQFLEKNTVRLVERFQWPLAFAVWCFLFSLCYEFPVRPRPRAMVLRAREAGDRRPEAGKLAATAALLFFLVPVSSLPPPARAAEAAPPVAPSAALSKIVGRVAAASAPSARDWAELARETVTWGSRIQSERQPVPEGPVRDALSAVSLGQSLDAKTADWPKLREELETLLEKKDDEKKDDQQQKQQDKDKQQKDQDNKKEQSDQQQNQQSNQNQDDKPEQGQPKDQKSDQNDNTQQKQSDTDDRKQGESAFGDMKKPEQPPEEQPPAETQKVGGNKEEKQAQAEPADPSLAIPLQKLEQIRSQDSPARLFQLMEGERKPDQKKPGKDW